MKLPNGYGSVYKLSGKRRKPWIVRKTAGWQFDENGKKSKQMYETIGYFATRQEALTALANYNQNPYDIEQNSVTFSELYEKWSDVHYQKISESTVKNYINAYKHLKVLYSMKFCEIKANHIEGAINNERCGDSVKVIMRLLCKQLFDYAIRYEIVEKNYAAISDTITSTTPSIIRTEFTNNEIKTLWDNLDVPLVNIVLVSIYSGWRPSEIINLKNSDLDLENWVFEGGLKTDAGKNRRVPVHSKIQGIVKDCYNEAITLKSEYLFLYKGKNLKSYKIYQYHFKVLMKRFGMEHNPHDTRHTFITLAKRFSLNEYVIKKIVGHSISDITEKVYTHRGMDELRTEIEKIKI